VLGKLSGINEVVELFAGQIRKLAALGLREALANVASFLRRKGKRYGVLLARSIAGNHWHSVPPIAVRVQCAIGLGLVTQETGRRTTRPCDTYV
jgi:hypothetical protein